MKSHQCLFWVRRVLLSAHAIPSLTCLQCDVTPVHVGFFNQLYSSSIWSVHNISGLFLCKQDSKGVERILATLRRCHFINGRAKLRRTRAFCCRTKPISPPLSAFCSCHCSAIHSVFSSIPFFLLFFFFFFFWSVVVSYWIKPISFSFFFCAMSDIVEQNYLRWHLQKGKMPAGCLCAWPLGQGDGITWPNAA